MVDSLFADYSFELTPPSYAKGSFNIIIRDVPLTRDDKWAYTFQVSGSAIDSHIGEIERYAETTPMSYSRRLKYLIFSEESQLTVYLSKEQ